MWCAGCASAAENVIRNQPGVKSADVSFAAEKGRIDYDPDVIALEDILKKLDALGYRARLLSDTSEQQEAHSQEEKTLWQLLVAFGIGMQVMLIYLVQLYPRYVRGEFNAPGVRNLQYLVWGLTTPILLYGGSSILKGAWRALRARTATMDTLVALGTLSAYFYSAYVALTGQGEVYFDSIVMITVFIMLGRYLENVGGAQARKDIRSLLKLQPDEAHRKQGAQWKTVPIAKIGVDDFLLVKPGERIPADGLVTDGSASINEAVLTGESMPVTRGKGDFVFAGTLVQDAAIQMQVTRDVSKSRLAQIAQLVDDTLSQKAPIQRLADKAAAIFAFAIIAIAVVTLSVRLILGQPLDHSLLTAVSVLVVACPCALGLATPLSLVVTLGRATREGLIVRNQSAFETSSGITEVVFDKTGTLTLGELAVDKLEIGANAGESSQAILKMAASIEQFSEHAIAAAVIAAYEGERFKPQDFKIKKGFGAQGRIKGRTVKIGSQRYFENPPADELLARSKKSAAKSQTIIWVGWDETPQAFITLSDQPNPSAREAVAQLKAMGMRVSMLSGDTPATCQVIARSLKIDDYRGFCTPDEKAAIVKEKQDQGGKIAFVGDGVNDAPALAQADLSFTASGGTDIAGETSDVILTQADLQRIPWFIRLSEKTRRVIIENLVWAFAYNMISVPLAALGLITPVIAAVSMACSSLLVVGNSIRLRKLAIEPKK
ncbi:MAG: P-type Cu+ transporter [Chloroflexota bacterium]|nr:P-type Cu+ transporter [Chloroflexota bacterium]